MRKGVFTALILILFAATGLGVITLAAAFFNETPRGEKPTVTPQLFIEEPSKRKLKANRPLVVRVRFKDLSYRPEIRTGNAAATLGMTSQVTVDGRVQGHIHIYAQKLNAESGRANPFCIFELEHLIASEGYNGVVQRECGVLTPGDWRIMVDVNTDSHDSVYKAHPQEVPAGDTVRVNVREDDDD